MKPFEGTAPYYDRLYAGKDYDQETDFLELLFAIHGVTPATILDLACGTGSHGLRLLRHGYRVSGVDLSAAMLREFEAKAQSEGLALSTYEQDLRHLDVPGPFDAAICMGDAIGYVTENQELGATLERIRGLIRPDGILILEFWHATPMLRAHETVRLREIRLEDGIGIRLSETRLDEISQTGEVRFRLLTLAGDRLTGDIIERHVLRYFLPQEMAFILEATGWSTPHLYPACRADRSPSPEDWHLIAVARAR